jgi:hypothetical protein
MHRKVLFFFSANAGKSFFLQKKNREYNETAETAKETII